MLESSAQGRLVRAQSAQVYSVLKLVLSEERWQPMPTTAGAMEDTMVVAMAAVTDITDPLTGIVFCGS